MKTVKNKTIRGVFLGVLALSLPQAYSQTNGVMVLQNLTTPRGGAWLPGQLGGHFWVSDGALGICRVNPSGTAFQTGNCSGTAKSGGQIAVGPIGGAANGTTYVFLPDTSAKSTSVVRYQFRPSDETFTSTLVMNVSTNNTIGGGAAGARPVAAAISPTGELYVGFLKSGSIMKVATALTTTSGSPVVTQVAQTSDNKGVTALLFFGNDLYVAEAGGAGLSMIPDPSGLSGRPACAAAAPCHAAPIAPQISFFPGGLAKDSLAIYVADSPLTTPGSVLRYAPTAAISATNPTVYSVNVPPYVSTFDGKTRSQYEGIGGLAMAPNGDLYVSDDPTLNLVLAVLPTNQGHLWRVPLPVAPPTIQSIAPNSGPEGGGTDVTITGTNFSIVANATQVTFGGLAAQSVTCSTATSCVARTPQMAGGGVVDVKVTVGAQSATAAGAFTFIPNAPGTNVPVVSSISPAIGLPSGGTRVTVQGTDVYVAGQVTTVTFGTAGPGTVINCAAVTPATATVNSQCVVASPAGTGAVDIQINVNGRISGATAADRFTYTAPTATLFAWGITAPKGGMTFIPKDATNGHMWSSDHAQGFCRQDPLTARGAGLGTPSSPGSATLNAINLVVCDNGTIGSPGQAVYDPRVNPLFVNSTSGSTIPAGTHFIYVPDNAVKSTAVWRLTFNPATETLVDQPEAMVPLADLRTLKPNGMALGPDGNLYVTDLVEMNVRRITNVNGDPRLQTVSIVAVTGDGRGANGSIGFLGNKLYISENRAAAWFDITQCPTATGPCATNPIPLPSGAFVAGVATDQTNGYVYAADSPGGANATIWRWDSNNPAAPAIVYLTGGQLPAAGTPEATVWIHQQGVRPWNPRYTPGGIAGFSFAFGISVDPRNGSLYVTGDPTAGARAGIGTAFVAKLVQ